MGVIRTSLPKARKDHQCDYCCLTINKGEIYERATVIGECGDIYEWTSHVDCGAIATKLKMHDCNGGQGVTGDLFIEIIENAHSDLVSLGKVTDFGYEERLDHDYFSEMLRKVIEFHLKGKTNGN